jgi:hypothetical protein
VKLFQNLFRLWKSAFAKGFDTLRMIIGTVEDAEKYYFPYDMEKALALEYYQKFKEEPTTLIVAFYKDGQQPTSKDKFRARDLHLVCGTEDKLVLVEEQHENASILGIEKSQIIYVSDAPHAIPLDPIRWESCASQILERIYQVNSIKITTNKILEQLAFSKDSSKKLGTKPTTTTMLQKLIWKKRSIIYSVEKLLFLKVVT